MSNNPSAENDSENRVIQNVINSQTSVSTYAGSIMHKDSITLGIDKTTAESDSETVGEYDVTKPRRIIIRARIDDGKGS